MQGLIDMHCHIVPGVDDGARDLYDAAKILQLEYRNQVQSVIVTPHYRAGMFETPQKEVERQFQRIDEMTRRSRSGMRVYLGCEYHTNAHMVEDLKKGLRPTMAGTEYVLVEFSGRHNYQIIRNQVYALLAAGYRPIIAHAERYPCLTKTPALVQELVHMGEDPASGVPDREHRKQYSALVFSLSPYGKTVSAAIHSFPKHSLT